MDFLASAWLPIMRWKREQEAQTIWPLLRLIFVLFLLEFSIVGKGAANNTR